MNARPRASATPSVSGMRRPLTPARVIAIVSVWFVVGPLAAEDDFERPPISYSETEPANAVTELQDRLARGDAQLAFDKSSGYLRSVLALLHVPISSQTLVFSKTSLQVRVITPRNPRAIYFNDDVYVGFVRGGEVLEISVADPKLGTVFYTLEQDFHEQPKFIRQADNCLICHGGSHTRGVPGHIVRSLYTDRSGQPMFSAGSHRVDDTTPLANRWGGWYVTGRHGTATHLGNITYSQRLTPDAEVDTSGLNENDLSDRFDPTGYLSPHSDIVALSVLAHQASAHTILVKASFDARTALHREASLNRELGEAPTYRWPSTNAVLDAAAVSLVDCFLFSGAAPLPAPIEGTTSFSKDFASMGPADARGRSLRALDLEERLFRYPCSFLIYSKSFDDLPEELRRRFWAQLGAVLRGGEMGVKYAHLTAADRSAICGILLDTKSDAPRDWAAR